MRTIIITGASGGLAQEMVKLLPHDRLILVGRSKAKLEKLYGERENIDLVELDITDSSALERLTASTVVLMSWSVTLAMGFLKNLIKSALVILRPCLKSIPLP